MKYIIGVITGIALAISAAVVFSPHPEKLDEYVGGRYKEPVPEWKKHIMERFTKVE